MNAHDKLDLQVITKVMIEISTLITLVFHNYDVVNQIS